MPRITFLPANVSIDVEAGANIRDAGIQAGVQIPSTCGGVASCGLCKVKILAGAEHLCPVTPGEISKLGNVYFITKERLACQTTVSGDVQCAIPDDMADRMQRQLRGKDGLRPLPDRSKMRR